jgi:uncharacterized protein YutE (UPF0331/DUF86 family)
MIRTPQEHSPKRPSKGQRRINTILQRIPAAREQLLVAMESFPPDFGLTALIVAADDDDARERNKVAVIEREYEVLLNWCNELAARLLAEGQRLGAVEKDSGYPWERLAALGVISTRSATSLQEAMDMRDDLAHSYPPTNWRSLHEGVNTLLRELDRYIDRVAQWAVDEGILLSDLSGSVTFATSDDDLIVPPPERWDAA